MILVCIFSHLQARFMTLIHTFHFLPKRRGSSSSTIGIIGPGLY